MSGHPNLCDSRIRASIGPTPSSPLSSLDSIISKTKHTHYLLYCAQEEGKPGEKMEAVSLSTNNENSISCLAGTGNRMWLGIYFVVSAMGFIAFSILFEVYYVKPQKVTAWWCKGLIFTVGMVLSVVMVGGIVLFFWYKWERRCSSYEKRADDDKNSSLGQWPVLDEANKANLASMQKIQYGSRPDFPGIICFLFLSVS